MTLTSAQLSQRTTATTARATTSRANSIAHAIPASRVPHATPTSTTALHDHASMAHALTAFNRTLAIAFQAILVYCAIATLTSAPIRRAAVTAIVSTASTHTHAFATYQATLASTVRST